MRADQALKWYKVPALQRIGIILSLIVLLLLGACQGAGPSSSEAQPLQANAGEDIQVNVGASPAFDGCASTGAITNYMWTIVEAPKEMAEYDGKVIREIDANCSYTLEASMLVDEVGLWKVELEIKDEQDNASTDTVSVEVVP